MPPPDTEATKTQEQVGELFDSAELSAAIDTGEFKLFLDFVPIALAISKSLGGRQRIVFGNKACESLIGSPLATVAGRDWSIFDSFRLEDEPDRKFSEVLPQSDDFAGTFRRDQPGPVLVEAYTSLIVNEEGAENYRIVALIDVTARERAQREEFSQQLRDKDMLLKEIQHRVKNNLQLITALIRIDARAQRRGDKVDLDRLAGRIESLQILYRDLSADGLGQVVDLGHYVSQIASSVMHTYAVEGIRLDLKVDYAPVSINIAMPVGLLVNELLTNSFKYAFAAGGTGVITVRCLNEGETAYRIVIADDGRGMPEGTTWPASGKLGALILQTLTENADTTFTLETRPGDGTRVSIGLTRPAPVAPKPN